MSLDTTITPIDKPTDVSQPTTLVENPPGVETTPGGARASIDLFAATPDQLAAPTEVQAAFLKTVPLDYTDKEWVKNFAKSEKPIEELFKSYENQRSAISRKTEGGIKVPDATATPEQRAEFYKLLGVPEKADDYEYSPPPAPKGMEQYYQVDDTLLSKMKEAAHKEGMTPAQWKSQVQVYNERISAEIEKRVTEYNQQQKAAQDTFNKQYGDKGAAVLSNLEKASSSAPEWARADLQNLSPGQKIAVAGLLFDFSTKYVGEDTLDVKSLQGQPTMTEKDYGDEFEKAYATMRQYRRQPQSVEYLTAVQKVATLRAQQRQMAEKR